MAAAFHHGRAVVHAGGHRRAQADRRAQPRETDNDELLLRRLAPFLLAGLKAPLPELSDVTRELDGDARRAD